MIIGGFQKLTLVDYPGKVAATIFTVGCNFRCPYCHNPELVLPELINKQPRISEDEILTFLKEKQGLIQGVCITGGEPTLQQDLESFLKTIKALNYLIKLDTNGSDPELLKTLIKKKLIDYVAMDIKAPLEKYEIFTLNNIPLDNIIKSIAIIKSSHIDYEFRTTVVPKLIDKDDILKIVTLIKPAQKYFLQNFKGIKTLDPEFQNIPSFEEKILQDIISQIKPFFIKCELR